MIKFQSNVSNFRRENVCAKLAVGLLLCLAVSLVGCTNEAPLTKAGGILKVDGNPVLGASGTIEFYPVGGGRTAIGSLQEDGTFTVSYLKPGDGLPPGKYKVAVLAEIFQPPAGKSAAQNDLAADDEGFMVASGGKSKHVVPLSYNNIETTPLEHEIIDDGKVQYVELDIRLKK